MATSNVDVLIHAVAMKQVPAAEYNPQECIKTNINGAENVRCRSSNNMKKSLHFPPTAASPVNLYGASKLVSDKLFVSANNLAGGKPAVFLL